VNDAAAPLVLQHRPRVRYLRAMAFAGHADVPSALRDVRFTAPAPVVTAMLVFDGTTIFELNLVSAFAWDLLRTPCTLEQVVEAVTTVFGVDQAIAQADLGPLWETLRSQNLLTTVS
jgi:Coenzyme PQQ synthesis protein D (PqqD)